VALDPFNTIYGSNNLVAPPGILDFSFELMFDRQSENASGAMPRGVLEDFDYFDLVVRGIVPDPGAPQVQDNGIMMVNPRNITVVFSPQLSVQGRPYNASVSYDKFDHRMRPIRMTIRISMKAFYFGPVRRDYTFAVAKNDGIYAATIPYDESITYTTTVEKIVAAKVELTNLDFIKSSGGAANGGGGGEASDGARVLGQIRDMSSAPNQAIRLAALAAAESLRDSTCPYEQLRPIPDDPTRGLDCSGLVIWAYTKINALDAIGQTAGNGYTGSLLDKAFEMGTVIAGPGTFAPFNDEFMANYMQPGDLMISHNEHVAMVKQVNPDQGTVDTYESTPPYHTGTGGGPRHLNFRYSSLYGSPNNHTHCIRPAIAGQDTVGNLGLRV
jgi:hypothetical protein